MPDWNYNGKVWMPLSEPEGWEEGSDPKTGKRVQKVHILTRITATHTGDGPSTLTLEGIDYKPTGKRVVLPLEWWTLSINHELHRQIMRLEFRRVLDLSTCSTGGYSMVPGVLFAIGKPLPPGPEALRHPFPNFPPGDAVDPDDPNWWQLRLQIFQQMVGKTEEEKRDMVRLIDRQMSELQQHLDYLNALDQYLQQDRPVARDGDKDGDEANEHGDLP
mmetsp:Transcript_6268/g.20069  ORF Transcript_6268/g.20069 Transcript_6268/m.20069 type:complete len:218 (+) Transcript_6268:256-909(+)